LPEFHAELLQEAVNVENITAELGKIDPVEFFAKVQKCFRKNLQFIQISELWK
jgi:hypothetical protein